MNKRRNVSKASLSKHRRTPNVDPYARRELKRFQAQRLRFERGLTTWERWIKHLERRLITRLLDGQNRAFYKKGQTHYVERIASLVLELMREKDLNYRNAKAAEAHFDDIEWVAILKANADSRETMKRVSESLSDLQHSSNRKWKEALQLALDELNALQQRFHQLPDPHRQVLFVKATYRYFNVAGNSRTKRGYTFTRALEDENETGQHLPSNEFDQDFVELANHYKKWRSRNKDLVMRIERGDNGVT